jgi:hypothetical protein
MNVNQKPFDKFLKKINLFETKELEKLNKEL